MEFRKKIKIKGNSVISPCGSEAPRDSCPTQGLPSPGDLDLASVVSAPPAHPLCSSRVVEIYHACSCLRAFAHSVSSAWDSLCTDVLGSFTCLCKCHLLTPSLPLLPSGVTFVTVYVLIWDTRGRCPDFLVH